jgi:hypothetical protein
VTAHADPPTNHLRAMGGNGKEQAKTDILGDESDIFLRSFFLVQTVLRDLFETCFVSKPQKLGILQFGVFSEVC